MTAEATGAALIAARRIIIKVGSALVSDGGAARTEWLADLLSDIQGLRERGKEVVLVSSGAIALGRGALGPTRPQKLEDKQAAAAFGQPRLMRAIDLAAAPHGLAVAQALLTLDDTENRRRWLNARAALSAILTARGLPVVNENDTVATDEIRYGDNDRLAARVAQMMSADLLVLLSDVDGLYTADPATDPAARHIPFLSEITPAHDAMASGANARAGVGTGGMATKLAAARIAYGAGCATLIADGRGQRPFSALIGGARATLIQPAITPATARETWLASHLKPEGTLVLDAGAVRALKAGASLLPVGVTGVDGMFERGAAVALAGPDGARIAIGVAAYSASDIEQIRGCQSDEVETRLGWRGRPALVHRDDMVLV